VNPLGSLPGASSPQFALNELDWRKILRGALVLTVGSFVTYGVPWLAGFKYVINGTDYTAIVLIVVNGLAEAARRFLSGAPK
jgi:hypothetical protein